MRGLPDCTAQLGEDHHVDENVQELINTDSLNEQLQMTMIMS